MSAASNQPQPSLADVLCVIAKERGPDEAFRLERAARKAMWKRLIAANQSAIEIEVAGLRDVTGSAYVAAQARIDALFAERNRMSDAAFGPMKPLEVRT